MLGLALWSVAIEWYWPNRLPQTIGLDYWKVTLGIERAAFLGAVSAVDALWTSIIAALVVVTLAMIISIPTGYVLATYDIPLKPVILMLFLMPQAFPQQPIFVNLMSFFYRVGLMGTLPGVILVHLMPSLVFAVWITSATFKSVKPELEEAARIVGASKMKAFLQVTLPLAAPGIVASSVYVFIYSLDEFTGTFFVGLPFVSTLPMLLYSASGYNMQFASCTAVMLLIPSILFMVAVERFLKAEYLAMGIKG